MLHKKNQGGDEFGGKQRESLQTRDPLKELAAAFNGEVSKFQYDRACELVGGQLLAEIERCMKAMRFTPGRMEDGIGKSVVAWEFFPVSSTAHNPPIENVFVDLADRKGSATVGLELTVWLDPTKASKESFSVLKSKMSDAQASNAEHGPDELSSEGGYMRVAWELKVEEVIPKLDTVLKHF